MGLFDNSARLDKRVAQQYPRTWELLEISSENAHGQEVSFDFASTIARVSEELADFPILVAVQSPTRVSTDGVMWTAHVRVAWPGGTSVESVMDVVRSSHFSLGKLYTAQRSGSYSDVLKSCTELGSKNGKLSKVWRCNYKKQGKAAVGESRGSETRSLEEYRKQIDGLIALTENYKTDECKLAQMKFVQKLGTNWRNGDTNALLALEQLIRREVNTHNYGQEQLQGAALREMASTPELSIEPLLLMVRDEDGSLAFPKDFSTYLHCPNKVLKTLEDFALNGCHADRLVYEFIRTGAKLDKEVPGFHGGGADACAGALFNIKRLVYADDETAMLSSVPALTEDEKGYLIARNYKTVS